ncbi:type VI secretion system-associated protein TagF [Reinekea marinisedimentorum]|uniref:type VI secretion system-associated protein TagF n=1 Tax=Reinekea marinisedimentorum TaxID=230495 RepID=UPI001404B400|nr:type VI secretion system-associated protein TagF [Reinekea marinisedimentorum]
MAVEVEVPRLSITGAYGKLPTESDFIQIDSNWREVRALDEILQSFYSELSRNQRLEHFRGCGLLLTGGSDRQGLVATVNPSEDKTGRFYPFVLFNRLADASFYNRPDATFTAGLSAIEDAIGEELQQADVNSSWLGLLKAQPEHVSPIDTRRAKRKAMELAEQVSLEDWLNELAGNDMQLREHLIGGTLLLIRQLKQSRVHRAYHGIWLPLLSGTKRHSSIAFWLQLLTGVMNSGSWRPDIVWTTSGANDRLFILTKPLTLSSLQATADAQAALAAFLGWNDVMDVGGLPDEIKANAQQWVSKPEANLLDVAIEWYQLV